MVSENAKAVAKEVIETVRKGRKVVLGKIIKKHGYSKSVSERPSKVVETKSYQKEITPVLTLLEKEIQRLQIAIAKKKLGGVRYAEAVKSLDLLIKNKQLLSGKNTDRVGVDLLGLLKKADENKDE